MRTSRRLLPWVSPFGPSTSRSWLAISNKPYIRRHGFVSESPMPRRTSGQARAFSSSRPSKFMLDGDSTIYALSTATGRAAIAVVRVSGPACTSVRIPRKTTQPHPVNPQTNKPFPDIQEPLSQRPASKTALCSPPHPLRPRSTPHQKYNSRRRLLSPLLPRATNSNRRRHPRTPHPRRTRNNKSRPLSHRTDKYNLTSSPVRRTRRVHTACVHE